MQRTLNQFERRSTYLGSAYTAFDTKLVMKTQAT